ncbi:MAG: hypothetical protein RL341_749 [Pseudomonadota bacterium]|jgi:hypothetical protein
MEKESARRQTLEQLHERRKQVVRLYKQEIKIMQIVTMTGLSYPTVRGAIDLFEAGGWSAIRPALRGRATGDGRVLSVVQEDAIQRMIIDKRTRAAQDGAQLVEPRCSGPAHRTRIWHQAANASRRQVPHPLGFYAAKADQKSLRTKPCGGAGLALQGEYPGIEQRARAQGAEIHWGDETALVNTDVRGRSFAPVGKTPVTLAVGGTRQKLSMIATVTNQGKTRWMIIDEAFDAEKLIEFLQALVKDAGKKVFLILDNLRVHHSKLVKAWVAERQDQIELFYLPSYSPQLNPEERLNADLKQEMGKRVPVRTKAKLREAANDHMAMLEQNPERVMRYFQDRRVRYAA